MIDFLQNTGLYWRALGGNNIDQISGHCYQYTRVLQKENSAQYSTILVDLGKFDNHQALGIRNSVAAVPDIRDVLQDKIWGLKALFLTHSHPDHLNGIVHYIRAGYRLPTLYGGRYTHMILDDLYLHYQIGRTKQPPFVEIKAGDTFKCGAFEIKVVSASHTCFDSFGFLIGDGTTTVYHSGDMKVDQTTFFKQPTDLELLKQCASQINYVVADFCGIDNDGVAFREADVLKTLVKIIKSSRKRKIFLPVYPTHVEMYVLAFLAAKELGKNVVFLGNEDFYDYLDMVRNYGIDFMSLAEDKIKVFVGVPEDVAVLQNNFVVIGAFNDIGDAFNETEQDSFALITARTYFNPLKGQMNARNIPFATLSDYPILQGAGHGFLGDWEIIHRILPNAVYIPTHCPCFVSDGFKSVAEALEFKMLAPTPSNNQWFRLSSEEYEMAHKAPATWLVVNEDGTLTEVWQKATSGMGFLKRTFSRRRTEQKFKMMLCRRKNKCKQ
jgi:phosphoribosyl 1,2-cyclic phosphodiesterase